MLHQAADRLWEARESAKPSAAVRDLLVDMTAADAYRVAELNVKRWMAGGGRASGWKAGLTSLAVQRQLGVASPDFGALMGEWEVGDDEPIALSRLLQPRIEAEVAFVLGSDLPDRPVGGTDVIRATDFVLPAIEVADSRIEGWDLTILDTVADNASSGLYVLGWKPTRMRDVDLREVVMSLSSETGPAVSEGAGAACLGHPVNAVVWLANTLHGLGTRLRAGDLVLSGALGPMVAVNRPGVFEAVIQGLGSVRARFV